MVPEAKWVINRFFCRRCTVVENYCWLERLFALFDSMVVVSTITLRDWEQEKNIRSRRSVSGITFIIRSDYVVCDWKSVSLWFAVVLMLFGSVAVAVSMAGQRICRGCSCGCCCSIHEPNVLIYFWSLLAEWWCFVECSALWFVIRNFQQI